MPSPKGKSPVLCQAATSYKKKPGQLVLTRSSLTWSTGTSTTGELAFDNARLNSLFMSKEGGAKVVMKVGILDKLGGVAPEESYNFTFTSGPSAISDREHFKREISLIISKNRAAAAGDSGPGSAAPSPGASPALNGSSGPASSSAFPGLPSPAEAARMAAASSNGLRADSVGPSSERGSPAPVASTSKTGAAPDVTRDWQIRNRLLRSQPDLANLHSSLVRTGLISEEEFWEGRENLLLSEAAVSMQRSGRSSQLVDPRPEQSDTGEVKITLSQQLIKDIFDQYPIVAKIYNENVPQPLSEGEFWHRYFHSKLFDRHRMTGRGALEEKGGGMAGKGKDDAIFDKYLEDEDDDLEPKNARDDDVYKLLDLAATEEDHGETGNAKDFTMRAGSQRKSLPLMRRFNEHSERLLIQSLGASGAFRRGGPSRNIDGGDAGSRKYYDDIVYEDLEGRDQESSIPLVVKEGMHQGMQQQAQAQSIAATNGNKDESNGVSAGRKRKRLTSEEVEDVLDTSYQRLRTFNPNLGTFDLPTSDAAPSASVAFTALLASRLSSSSSSGNNLSKLFPEPILRSLISLHSSTNEFLRHFWSALLPAHANDISASGLATPAQKGAKAQRMLEFLEKTEERLEGVCKEVRDRVGSQRELSDGAAGGEEMEDSVRKAMGPLLLAVKKAREEWRRRGGQSKK